MMEFSPYSRLLARLILVREARGDTGPAGLAMAAERVYQKLSERLILLIGVEGVLALLRRSLQQVRGANPFLANVKIDAKSQSLIQGLVESVEGQTGSAARDGLEAFIAGFIDLLVTFIGEGLTAQQLRRVWPDVAIGQEAER